MLRRLTILHRSIFVAISVVVAIVILIFVVYVLFRRRHHHLFVHTQEEECFFLNDHVHRMMSTNKKEFVAPLSQSCTYEPLAQKKRFIWCPVNTPDLLETFLNELQPPIGDVVIQFDVQSFPSEYPESIVQRILTHPYIRIAYIKNLEWDTVHPKVRFAPIGIDFHTIARGPRWGVPKTSVAQQIQTLQHIYKTFAIPNPQRECAIAITFPLERNHYTDTRTEERSARMQYQPALLTREACAIYLEKSSVSSFVRKPRKFIDRESAWERMCTCAFTLSPLGAGYDCHRTWEALLLGSIVIVPWSPISAHLQRMRLPVIVIRSLHEITPYNLLKWHSEYAPRVLVPQIRTLLSSEFWAEQFTFEQSRKIHGGRRVV